MAACCTSAFAIRFAKRDHSEGQSLMASLPHYTRMSVIIDKYHGPVPKGYIFAIKCQKEIDTKDLFNVDASMCIGKLKSNSDIKVVEFTCKGDLNEKQQTEDLLRMCGQEATKTAVKPSKF